VVTSVKHFQPPTQKCTCSLNFICANVCCSQSQRSNVGQVHVESCDDFIAQENYQLKLEVKRFEAKLRVNVLVQPTQDNRSNMMNKLESRTIATRLASQRKDKPLHHKRQEKTKKDQKHIQCL
jgi:hypothetical protein